MDTSTESQQATELSRWSLAKWRIWQWYRMQVINRLPHLVWRHQDVDVSIEITIATREQFEILSQVEAGLSKLGLSFDTGYGGCGRDWEWDYSLRGPVRIKFCNVRKTPRVPFGQRCDVAAETEKSPIFDHFIQPSESMRGN